MTLRRLLPMPMLAVALAAPPQAAAYQDDWSGANGFRILVTDDAGQPVSEVTVVVRLAEADRSGGPPPMLTDAAGALEVRNLAAGEWEIRLRRQGFMIVNSYLRLADGKRPQVGFTSRQRTGPFWAPMNVGYSSLGAAPAPGSAGSARATSRAQRLAERRAEQRERRLRRGNVARIVELPKAERSPETSAETPTSTSASEAQMPAEPVVTASQSGEDPPLSTARPLPEPALAPVEVVERPAPAAVPANPAEQPEPEPVELVERPAPDPVPVGSADQPVSAPDAEPVLVRLLANPTLRRAGACPECAPGEWSVSSHWPAEPRTAETTACAPDLAGRMERVAGLTFASLPKDFRAYAGALASPEGNDVLRLLPEAPRAEVRELLAPVLGPERSCQVVAVLLPKDARFVGFQYEAADLGARSGCFPDQPCGIGEARWQGNPVVHRHDHGTFVYGVFENLSSEDRREANLKVYFRPPRGWLPPR